MNTDTLGNGDVTIHVRVNDPDFDVSATGEDKIARNQMHHYTSSQTNNKQRQNSVVLGYAGGVSTFAGVIDIVGTNTDLDDS